METTARSKAPALFFGLLLAAGWPLAAWLGWRAFAPTAGSRPGTADSEGGNPAVARTFAEWSAQPELAGAAIGFCLLDDAGKIAYASPLAGTALCPASALKTVTTGAALHLLGPDFRFETVLSATAAPDAQGAVAGDLILLGAGDPTLAGEDLEALAAEVARQVRTVSGVLRVDASICPDPPVNDHWVWGDLGNAYGTGAYGLNLDHNRLTLHFAPGARDGEPAALKGSTPAMPGLRWLNRVSTGPAGSGDGVMAYAEPYGATMTLTGTVPAGESDFDVGAAVPNPPALVQRTLEAALVRAGVKFARRTLPLATNRVPLARHRSAPLPEIIDHLHRVSDNLEAQCLFLAIGRRQGVDPVQAIRQHWEAAGVNFTALRMVDGSGLARANAIRPLDLARVNQAARRGPNGARFYQSLNPGRDGFSRAKLGAMSGVKTEVGFLTGRDGREWTYAILANGLDLQVNFWPLKGQLLERLRSDLP